MTFMEMQKIQETTIVSECKLRHLLHRIALDMPSRYPSENISHIVEPSGTYLRFELGNLLFINWVWSEEKIKWKYVVLHWEKTSQSITLSVDDAVLCPYMMEGARNFCEIFFIWILIPFMRKKLSWPNYLPIPSLLWVIISTWILGRHRCSEHSTQI